MIPTKKEGEKSQKVLAIHNRHKPFHKRSIVHKLFDRQIGSPLARSFENSCYTEIFQHLSLRQQLVLHNDSDDKHKLLAPSLRRASRIIEITAAENIIVVLEERGLCVAFDAITGRRLCYLNDQDEFVRSLFHNKPNGAIITVFVSKVDNYSRLRCRSIPFQLIRRGKPEDGMLIFQSETFTYPGFVEFDDVNSKVLTFSSCERRYRVWNLRNYEFLFDIDGESVSEVKISPGIVLVIHHSKRGYLPLSLLSIEHGEIIKTFNQIIHRNKKIDLVEQFNEYLLLKQEGCNLRIINVLQNSAVEVGQTQFVAPNGFIFLFEKRRFLTLRGPQVLIWNFSGEQITKFENHQLMCQSSNSGNIFITKRQDLIISYCSHKTLSGFEGSINVSDTTSGESVAVVTGDKVNFADEDMRRRFSNALDGTTALFFNEDRFELYTGTKDGGLFIWSSWSSPTSLSVN